MESLKILLRKIEIPEKYDYENQFQLILIDTLMWENKKFYRNYV